MRCLTAAIWQNSLSAHWLLHVSTARHTYEITAPLQILLFYVLSMPHDNVVSYTRTVGYGANAANNSCSIFTPAVFLHSRNSLAAEFCSAHTPPADPVFTALAAFLFACCSLNLRQRGHILLMPHCTRVDSTARFHVFCFFYVSSCQDANFSAAANIKRFFCINKCPEKAKPNGRKCRYLHQSYCACLL